MLTADCFGKILIIDLLPDTENENRKLKGHAHASYAVMHYVEMDAQKPEVPSYNLTRLRIMKRSLLC